MHFLLSGMGIKIKSTKWFCCLPMRLILFFLQILKGGERTGWWPEKGEITGSWSEREANKEKSYKSLV